MTSPDVVYIVRPGDANPELRWSLRSLANLPHGEVWIAGHRPAWCTAAHLPVPERPSKRESILAKLLAVVECDQMPDRVVLFDDDMFVMHPTPRVPVMHAGLARQQLAEHVAARPDSPYTRSLADTLIMLDEWCVDSPLTYELHYPIEIRRPQLRLVLDRMLSTAAAMGWAGERAAAVRWRNLYGNVLRLGGQRVEDCAGQRPGWNSASYLATSDSLWRASPMGEYIRSAFPAASPYER